MRSGAAATSATVTPRAKCAMDEPVVVRGAVRNAVRNNRDVSRVTRSATAKRAQRPPTRKRETLRYLRAGAIWTALPIRDQRLLLWLLGADVVTAQLAALLEGREPTRPVASADKVVAKLRALPETWAMATPDGRAELLNAIYERIVVRGPEFVSARLTRDAYAMGLALALPEHVRPAQEWVLAPPCSI